MSTVMHVIHSNIVKGIGMVIGGPYGFDWAGYEYGEIPDGMMERTYDLVREYHEKGLIDDPNNLRDSPVYIITGKDDSEVPPVLQEYTAEFYEHYDAKPRV